MKAIIIIIILALVAWGIWWFVREPAETDLGTNNPPAGTVLDVETDTEVDLSEFQDKG